MSDFQPIAVFVKQSEIDSQLRQFNERKNYFQVIVDMYNQSDIAEPLQENDLFDLVNTPKDFIIKKITKDIDLNLGGLKLDAEKTFEILEKPKGTTELIKYIEASKIANSSQKFFYRHARQFVTINDVVDISPTELERINKSFTVYVNNQSEKDFFDLLTTICNSINDLNQLKRIYHVNEALFRDFLYYNSNSEIVSVNPNFKSIFNT